MLWMITNSISMPSLIYLLCRCYLFRAFLVFFSLVLTYLNYRGLHLVGNMAVVMAIFTLLPFVMLCIMGKTEQMRFSPV